MTYDLALYPAAGPGLGHLMRCYALAEAAADWGKRVVVVLEKPAPDIDWPCAVELRGARGADVVIVDGEPNMSAGPAWFVIDEPPDIVDPRERHVEGYIYPHFGATPIDGRPTFVGPQWMPLRKVFLRLGEPVKRRGCVSYGVTPDDEPAMALAGRAAHDIACELLGAARALLPPSTIAYEAMACGCPVMLLPGVSPACDRVGEAMVGAGVAVWHGADPLPPARHIDGEGALRLLEALL